ncbi:MAG: RTX toxin, partial [Deltaproteobacteria bacterium]|nr:RTX toxin [Deltaproteobacteria bacterium]
MKSLRWVLGLIGILGIGAMAVVGVDKESRAWADDKEDTPVSSGFFHNCEVRNGGKAACWGSNFFGQANAPGGTFVQVSAGLFHTCGVLSNGSVQCWGDNSAGQASPPGGTFVQVSAG